MLAWAPSSSLPPPWERRKPCTTSGSPESINPSSTRRRRRSRPTSSRRWASPPNRPRSGLPQMKSRGKGSRSIQRAVLGVHSLPHIIGWPIWLSTPINKKNPGGTHGNNKRNAGKTEARRRSSRAALEELPQRGTPSAYGETSPGGPGRQGQRCICIRDKEAVQRPRESAFAPMHALAKEIPTTRGRPREKPFRFCGPMLDEQGGATKDGGSSGWWGRRLHNPKLVALFYHGLSPDPSCTGRTCAPRCMSTRALALQRKSSAASRPPIA